MFNHENGDDENQGHLFGSALNPASLHSGGEKKELAKPNAKVEVRTTGRSKTGGALDAKIKEEEEK